jgi:hypothetical protein
MTSDTKQAESCYLFSFFRGNGEDGLFLARSEDGYDWTELPGGPFLRPTVGGKLMRDPCLALGPDGVFRLVWTTGWSADLPSVGYAWSADLLTWSPQHAIPAMSAEPKTRNIWAPEVFWDADSEDWLLCWSSTIPGRFPDTDASGDDGYNHRTYATTTKDFRYFSPTRPFFDAGFNVIDDTLLHFAGRYWLIVKDETKTPVRKNLRVAVSDHAYGPFEDLSAPFTGSWVEGPSALRVGDEVLIYFDCYTAGHYGAVRTEDMVHFEDVTARLHMPAGARHGTALRVPRAVVEGLEKR